MKSIKDLIDSISVTYCPYLCTDTNHQEMDYGDCHITGQPCYSMVAYKNCSVYLEEVE